MLRRARDPDLRPAWRHSSARYPALQGTSQVGLWAMPATPSRPCWRCCGLLVTRICDRPGATPRRDIRPCRAPRRSAYGPCRPLHFEVTRATVARSRSCSRWRTGVFPVIRSMASGSISAASGARFQRINWSLAEALAGGERGPDVPVMFGDVEHVFLEDEFIADGDGAANAALCPRGGGRRSCPGGSRGCPRSGSSEPVIRGGARDRHHALRWQGYYQAIHGRAEGAGQPWAARSTSTIFADWRRLFLPVHLPILTPLLGHSGAVAGDVDFQDHRVTRHAVDGRCGGGTPQRQIRSGICCVVPMG